MLLVLGKLVLLFSVDPLYNGTSEMTLYVEVSLIHRLSITVMYYCRRRRTVVNRGVLYL